MGAIVGFVKAKHDKSMLQRLARLLLNVVMLLGPFVEWEGGRRRLKFVVPREIEKKVPDKVVKLDPQRITEVFVADDKFYVAYDTDKVSYYKNYLARLPSDAKRLNELKGKIGCVIDGETYYDLDFCWEYYMAEGAVDWIEKTYWRQRESPPPIDLQGEPELTVVTENNLEYAIEKLFGDSSWGRYYWTAAGHIWVEFVKELEKRNVRVGESVLEYTRGLGYEDHSSYDELPWETGFGEYECVSLPGEKGIMYCRFKPNEKIVEELSSRDYSLFLKNIDKLRGQYGDWVLDYVEWMDEHAPLLVKRFPERFRDKLNEIAEKVVEMLRENPRLYVEKLPRKFYGYSYLSYWVRDLEDKKQYLRPELARELEEVKRRAEELLEAERERARREEEERRRREVERIRRELEAWRNYVEVEEEDGKLVIKRKRFMARELFDRMIRKLKELGFRFDPRTKEWYRYILSVFRI